MKSIAPIKDSHFVPLYLILIYYSFFIILLGCKVCAVKVSSYPEPINGHDQWTRCPSENKYLWKLPVAWEGMPMTERTAYLKPVVIGGVLADHSGI